MLDPGELFYHPFNRLTFQICFLSVPLCEAFLSRKWYAFNGREMQGGESNSLLEQLLKGYFKDAKFSFIRSTLQWMESEMAELKAKGGVLNTMPCIKMYGIYSFTAHLNYSLRIDSIGFVSYFQSEFSGVIS